MEIRMSSETAAQYAIIASRTTLPFKSAFQVRAVERNANQQPLLGDERAQQRGADGHQQNAEDSQRRVL